MVAISVLCTLTGLLEAAASRTLLPRQENDTIDGALIPKFISDFKKDGAPAQWATGYPKQWGSEDFHLQFNAPEPDDIFNGLVADDEKTVGMFNGSHVTFLNLDSKATLSTFSLGPSDLYKGGLILNKSSKGGYNALISGSTAKYGGTRKIIQRRLSSDFKPIGEETSYEAGDIIDFDKNGRVATIWGQIIDLESDNATAVMLKDPPQITDMSFSPDGQYISTVGWPDPSGKGAILWNATSGEKIIQFPPTNAQNWVTKISPDNKYVLLALGTGSIQLYSLANLTAAPVVLGGFNGWIRAIAWSPDGTHLATGDRGRVQIWKFPEAEVVQTWEVESKSLDYGYEVYGISWVDGGNKVGWGFRLGRYMYDFERNERFWWTMGLDDHSWGGGGGPVYLKGRELVVTVDGDSLMRFWKI
ncbi:WD40 repeat-like protein [Lentithecium fluviatile CBS 122367]|uniref:WD40 repeat-like protein n=1 Tax=Lentithecium fluviatile CBS 122367 TaxID=1168545 RepID=A0A6G1IHB3_9PLEO|nr:WD40 repeat-like protein [Lentithecium fluviatile CBS 122367]